MTTETDYKKLVDDKFTEWGDLFERHKTDADLFNLVKIQNHVWGIDDHEIANSIYVVLNDLGEYTHRVESTLNSAIEQVVVTSDNKRFDTAYVEGFIKAGYKESDELLSLKGEDYLDPFLDQQNFRRGSEAVLFYYHIEKGELVPDIMPWDTGYFVCSHDNKGITFTGYKSYRPRDQILVEHPEASSVKMGDAADIEVLYILARDVSELWISGEKVKGQPNKLGYVPVIYRRVPIGSMLKDKESLKYRGESGLFLVRDIFLELSRFMSIIGSLNLLELDHALQRTKKEPTPNGADIPTVDEATRPGNIMEVGLGEAYTKMPIGELRAQAEVYHRAFQERIDRATLNNLPTMKPTTATEILAMSQEKDVIILPRLANRGFLKEDGARMFIKQTIAECEKYGIREVKLGEQTWEVSKLKGEYGIEVKYSFKDPRMDAARQSLATSQRGMRPDNWILRNTLMSEDPDGEERGLAFEKSIRESPLADLEWKIIKLLEDADKGNPYAEGIAIDLMAQYLPALRQVMQGMMPLSQKEEVKPTQPMMPLLPQTAGGVNNARP